MSHTATLTSTLGRVTLAEPLSSKSLRVFGLRQASPSPLAYRTLDEALGENLLEITEVSEGGSVPDLKLINKSDRRVFLMAGEQLIGAKQNRVLNTSILVEAHSEIPIPVSCVEQGRWGYRTKSFGSSGTSSHGALRSMLSETVTEHFAHSGEARSDQGKVWGEVSRKLGAHGSMSPTTALEKVYEDTTPKIDEMIADLPVPEGCSGAVFVIGDRVVGMDLFDQPETLRKLWSKLLRGYAIDAVEHGDKEADLDENYVREWLGRADKLESKAYPSPGLGEDVRLHGTEQTGAGLVVESLPVHVQLFASHKA